MLEIEKECHKIVNDWASRWHGESSILLRVTVAKHLTSRAKNHVDGAVPHEMAQNLDLHSHMVSKLLVLKRGYF